VEEEDVDLRLLVGLLGMLSAKLRSMTLAIDKSFRLRKRRDDDRLGTGKVGLDSNGGEEKTGACLERWANSGKGGSTVMGDSCS
jgi:hypothetical protein